MVQKEEYFTMDKITKDYLTEIQKIPLLTEEEERKLGERIVNGDKEAVNILSYHNLRLVIPFARRCALDSKRNFLDIVQDGNMGLMKAAEKFDISKGCKFSTYATPWIRSTIKKGIVDTDDVIRIPFNLYYFSKKVNEVKGKLKSQIGRVPNKREIALEMNVSIKNIELAEQAQKAKDIANNRESLYESIPNLDGVLVEETIASDYVQTPENWLSNFMNVDELYRLMEKSGLTKKEKSVLEVRYGLKDGIYKTDRVVGPILGVTQTRICQLEKRALAKLRASANSMRKQDPKADEKAKEKEFVKK